MKLVDLHKDLAYSNQREVDVVNGNVQSSIKMLKEFDSLVFASIFPHVEALDERSELLTSLYGTPTRSTYFSFDLFIDQVKFYYYLDRRGIAKVIRGKNDVKPKL
ncbi:MAG: hypothetical protein RXR43_15225 [Sulfolobus sp.]